MGWKSFSWSKCEKPFCTSRLRQQSRIDFTVVFIYLLIVSEVFKHLIICQETLSNSQIGHASCLSCTLCDKSFSQQSHLLEHSRIHTGEQPFSCTLCVKSFSRSSILLQHSRIHTREKPFGCIFCDKSFSSRYKVREHSRFHTGEKPYKCTHCNKCFARSGHLNRHLKVHTGWK